MELIPGKNLVIATILAEAGGEPYEGMVAVAKVIRNRTALGHFSNGTHADTVLRPYQFSCWNTDAPMRARVCSTETNSEACRKAEQAWHESQHSEVVPEDTVFYHASYVSPKWAKSPKVAFVKQIGRHLFYRSVA